MEENSTPQMIYCNLFDWTRLNVEQKFEMRNQAAVKQETKPLRRNVEGIEEPNHSR